MTKFEVGKTYQTRSTCDHNCIFTYDVIARTKKFITIKNEFDEIKRVGVSEYDGQEWASPEGRFSMSPTIRAGRIELYK